MIGSCSNAPLDFPTFDCYDKPAKIFSVLTRKIHSRLPRKIKKNKLNGFTKMVLTDPKMYVFAKLIRI